MTTIGGLATKPGATDGLGSSARFNWPEGIAVGATGNLYIADLRNDSIRLGVPLPTLSIVVSNNQAVLTWPVSAYNYALESASTLSSPGAWTAVKGLALTNNNTVTVIDSTTGSPVFYRLRAQ